MQTNVDDHFENADDLMEQDGSPINILGDDCNAQGNETPIEIDLTEEKSDVKNTEPTISVTFSGVDSNVRQQVDSFMRQLLDQPLDMDDTHGVEGTIEYRKEIELDSVKEKDIFKRKGTDLTVQITPRYTRGFDIPLPIPKDKQLSDLRRNMCFNCGAFDHSVRECPESRDEARIRLNKQKQMAKWTKKSRYTTDANYTEINFPHLKAGKLSDKLKNALGMREGDPPPFLNKMRRFGYPVDYLMVTHDSVESDLQWIEDCRNSNIESNEINEMADDYIDIPVCTCDSNLTVEFPGLNTQIPDDANDRWPKEHIDFRNTCLAPAERCKRRQKEALLKMKEQRKANAEAGGDVEMVEDDVGPEASVRRTVNVDEEVSGFMQNFLQSKRRTIDSLHEDDAEYSWP